ncbi:MAG: hypothetical protein FJZ90_00875 [Chloroflexi bacterium]|nr:hypothetical protein [Chloroflexota bacterium]
MSQRENLARAQARQEFLQARRAAALRRAWSGLTGKNNALIPFEDLRKQAGMLGQVYRGVQVVPLDKIIGSMGRSDDFDRAFLPTQQHSRGKWVSVDSAYLSGVSLPPITLYKVGDAYFVVDGHHRVSVARQAGQTFIDAEVTEVESRVPVSADLTIEDLDDLAAYKDFLEQTKLDRLRPGQDVRMTMPGDYAKLLDHIRVHKYFVDQERFQNMTWEEAVAHWYDTVYMPVVETIREKKLLADFPGHTEGDLYIWLIEHAYYLSQEVGYRLEPWEVAKDFVTRFGQQPQRLVDRIRKRVRDVIIPEELDTGPPAGTWRTERVEAGEHPHMFRDILVTVTGAETGWRALSQAAEIARLEDSVVHGLHVASSEDEAARTRGEQVLAEFTARCEALGLRSTTSLTVGDVAQRIIERARWSDLVFINQRREHGQWSERPLGTIFQTVLAQTPRPIMAVPGTKVVPPQHVLLAYDGSPKAREALYVLRYILTCWRIRGTIVTAEGNGCDQEMLGAARQYLEESGAEGVAMRCERGPAHEVILKVMGEENADLLLMGSFGYRPLLKAVLGSTVDRVLRVAWFPVLICR